MKLSQKKSNIGLTFEVLYVIILIVKVEKASGAGPKDDSPAAQLGKPPKTLESIWSGRRGTRSPNDSMKFPLSSGNMALKTLLMIATNQGDGIMETYWNSKGHLIVRGILNESMLEMINTIVDHAKLDVKWSEFNTVAAIICNGQIDKDRLINAWNEIS